MSNFKHTYPLMNKLTNIYKSGGVKRASSDSSSNEIKSSTHTCGRLLACAVLRVAFVVSLCLLLGACQKATLIPSEGDESSRGSEENTEAPKDTTNVDVNFDAEGWEGSTDVGFEFGGE